MKRPGGVFSTSMAAPYLAPMPIYVVSLDRAVERRTYIHAQMERLRLTYEIVEAVDGRQPISDLERLYDRRQRLRVYGSDLRPAEIACCLSHLEVCRRIAESKAEIGLVLEDDVILSPTVAPVLADLASLTEHNFDVVRLAGLRERRSKNIRKLSGGHNLARLAGGSCGTQAYVITAAGARKLIAYCTPITKQIDIALDETCFNQLNSYAVLPYPIHHEADINSTIGTRAADDTRRCLTGRYQTTRRTLRRNIGTLHSLLKMHLS